MSTFRALPKTLGSWRGKRVLVRVDWNIPLDGEIDGESDLRITRVFPCLQRLQEAGAVVVILTHLGRPTGVQPELSTAHLLERCQEYGLTITHHPHALDKAQERKELLEVLGAAEEGSLHLLENVRFFAGEEKNSLAFAKGLASLGEVFIQEAFSVCHRAHASVVGVAKLLPSYAGPALMREVEALTPFFAKAKLRGFQVFFGGKKLSTKASAIEALLDRVDEVFLGGALALTAERALGRETGKSFIEEGQQARIKRWMKTKRVHLPADYVVADALEEGARTWVVAPDQIPSDAYMVDIGPKTLASWSKSIKQAQRIIWNGPMGIAEIQPFGAGSRGLARYLAHLPKGAQVIVGGGDTIPLLAQADVISRISHVSTGGGALLDTLVQGYRLPGLSVLLGRK